MIALRSDCLVFRTSSGLHIPLEAEKVVIELLSDSPMSKETVVEAINAVMKHFRDELKKETVSVQEFSEALQKVLSQLGYNIIPADVSTEIEKKPKRTRKSRRWKLPD